MLWPTSRDLALLVASKGPRSRFYQQMCQKSLFFALFGPLTGQLKIPIPGPLAAQMAHLGPLKKGSLDTRARNPHPGPFELAGPGIQGPDQDVRNDHPGMPHMQESRLPTFCDHFLVSFCEHESMGLENLAGAGHWSRWSH